MGEPHNKDIGGEQVPALDPIGAVRRFNEYYFKRMAPIRAALLAHEYTPMDLRVMRELGRSKTGATSGWLVYAVGVDPGQLSRILKRFELLHFVTSKPSPLSPRYKHVQLTPTGWRAHASLECDANREVARILRHLRNGEQAQLVAALQTVEGLLRGGRVRAPAK